MGYGVTYSSPNGSPDQGEEERSQMIDWSPGRKWELLPSAEVGRKKVSFE